MVLKAVHHRHDYSYISGDMNIIKQTISIEVNTKMDE